MLHLIFLNFTIRQLRIKDEQKLIQNIWQYSVQKETMLKIVFLEINVKRRQVMEKKFPIQCKSRSVIDIQ